MYERSSITVPSGEMVSELSNGKNIKFSIGDIYNPIALTYGERTGACLRIKGAFDDLFKEYTKGARLEKVKTTNMGTLYELTYSVQMKPDANEKKFMDELRCRNGNLRIIMAVKETGGEKL